MSSEYDDFLKLVGPAPPNVRDPEAYASKVLLALAKRCPDRQASGRLLHAMRDEIAKHEDFINFVVSHGGGGNKANPWSAKSSVKYQHEMILFAFLKLKARWLQVPRSD